MKKMLILALGLLIAGCATTQGKITLSKDEIKVLSSKENITLSKELVQRLLENSNELKLTPQEIKVLKKTGKVVLCGDCGYILNSPEWKEFKAKPKKYDTPTGFADDSIRHRILGPYTD